MPNFNNMYGQYAVVLLVVDYQLIKQGVFGYDLGHSRALTSGVN